MRLQRSKPSAVEVGSLAPDFELTSTRGKSVRLGEPRGQSRTLLLFYPWNLRGG